MEILELYPMPDGMIVPYTFAFPLMRSSGLPREFRGEEARRRVTDSIYLLDFEYSFPLFM